jgi:hypothetical protein
MISKRLRVMICNYLNVFKNLGTPGYTGFGSADSILIIWIAHTHTQKILQIEIKKNKIKHAHTCSANIKVGWLHLRVNENKTKGNQYQRQ